MNSFVVLCVALVAFQTAQARVIGSLAPGLIGDINNCGCSSSILVPAVSPCSSPIIAPIQACPSPCPSSILASACPSPYAAVPVYQPNTVGSKLADTLSLLTVSSLLADALPIGAPCGCGGYGGYYY